ncbi:MAG: N-acetyltransferase family protein [Actinomycetota bacterium]
MDIRAGADLDLERINEIYNFYVVNTPATFDLEAMTRDARRTWFEQFGEGRHRLLVAVDDTALLGYAHSTKLRLSHRPAYDPSVSVSVYLKDGMLRRGIGTALYRQLFEALRGQDIHRAYAGITMPNDASVGLHEAFGFRKAGHFSEQGRKFGRYWDVAWFEKEM